MVLVVIAAIIGANFCLQALRKRNSGSAHQQLPTESSHSLFHASDSSSEHGGSTGAHHSVEDGRASKPSSSKPSGLSTERVKGLLAKSASFLKDRVGRKTTPRAGSKPAAGKDSKAEKSSGYNAVRSPFSIGGDEEEDDEEGFHDDGNGNDIRV